jgi:hypothetical protein
MNKRILIAGVVALGLGAAGTVHAQSATTAPPERMNGSSTTDNPATATTPPPGSPAALSSPASTVPALGSPADTAPGAHGAAHSDATPVPGANSFTEGEARSRMQDNGFAQISDLKQDNEGVWRAKATKDGKSVNVALDFKGNVVGQ